MTDDKKIILGVNGILEFITVIFIIFLRRYSMELLFIQAQYENKIEQALNVIREPRYLNYLVGGLVFAALLIAASVWNFKKIGESGVVSIVMMVVNIVVLVVLGIAFWNPIFTALLTVLVALGVGYAGASSA